MQIEINGEAREVADALKVAELLVELGSDQGPVAVELNGSVLPRSQHASTTLSDGDRLEVVTFVGGG